MATTRLARGVIVTVATAALAALVATACSDEVPTSTAIPPSPKPLEAPSPTPPPHRDLWIIPGEPLRVRSGYDSAWDQESYRIDFKRVTADSRCPAGATCAVAGRAVIEILVNDPSTGVPGELHLLAIGDPGPEPSEKAIGPYIVAFQALEPLPDADGAVPDFYTATLVVKAHEQR